MSKADEVFVAMCSDILTNGTDNKGEDVRPVWTDTNEPAYTLQDLVLSTAMICQRNFQQ